MYDYITNVLITRSPRPITDPEVKKSQLWFSGAKQANTGIGPFVIVIREYTQNQQRRLLRGIAPFGIRDNALHRASSETVNPANDLANGRNLAQVQTLAGDGQTGRAVDALSPGNDHRRGTPQPDTFDLLAGDDVGLGLAGDDGLRGGPGNDVIDGGPGDDFLRGDEGSDRLHGSEGMDTLEGGGDSDRLFGGDGNDDLAGGEGNDELDGGGGNDALRGGAGDDTLDGGPEVDRLRGGPGFDEYFFTIDDDLVPGTTIDDTGPNAIRFDSAMTPNMVTISVGGFDAIVRYGNSTVRIVGGASGDVISELRFAGQAPVVFAQFVSGRTGER